MAEDTVDNTVLVGQACGKRVVATAEDTVDNTVLVGQACGKRVVATAEDTVDNTVLVGQACGKRVVATAEDSVDNTVLVGQACRLARCLASYRLEPLVFLFTLASTLLMATSQNLIMDRVCSVNLGYNASVCGNITSSENVADENQVQRLANQYVLYTNLIEAGPGLLFALFMGSWSDAHGRKLPLLLPIAGIILSCAVYIVFSWVKTMPAQYLLFAAIPRALTGGGTIFLMAAFSYIGDVTGERERTARLGVLDVCFLAPLAIGYTVSGALLNNIGYVPLYCVSGGMNMLVLLYGIFLVPESRPAAVREATAHSSSAKSVVSRAFTTCFRKRHGYNRSTILLAMTGFTIHEMVLSGESNITLPYVKRVLNWNYEDYTHYVVIMLIICMGYNLLVLPLFSYVLRFRDSAIGLCCELATIAGFVMRGFAHSTEYFYVAAVIGLPGALVTATLRSIISKNVAKEELGVVFSFLAAAESVCTLVTSSAFLLIYNAVLDRGPGVIFFISAAISAPTLLVLGLCYVREWRGQMGYAQVVSEQEEQESREEPETISDDVSLFQQH